VIMQVPERIVVAGIFAFVYKIGWYIFVLHIFMKHFGSFKMLLREGVGRCKFTFSKFHYNQNFKQFKKNNSTNFWGFTHIKHIHF
jgi:hypothetical protein